MHYDRSLFGEGPYPNTGALAVVARLAFVIVLLGIVVAIVLPPRLVPHLVRSSYLQHFAAFYLLMLTAMAAAPRRRLRILALQMVGLISALEFARVMFGVPVNVVIDNWVADVGGMTAAMAPAVTERFRRRFSTPAR